MGESPLPEGAGMNLILPAANQNPPRVTDLLEFRLKAAQGSLDGLTEFVKTIEHRNRCLAELRKKLVDEESVIEEKFEQLQKAIRDIRWQSERKLPEKDDIKHAAESAERYLAA